MGSSEDGALLWEVRVSASAAKQGKKLPTAITPSLVRLLQELEKCGPIRKNWKNFGALSDISYHCHIKKGRPTYVVCWRIEDKKRRVIEVYYVGTHESAPY